jgi:lipoic acid synthetase
MKARLPTWFRKRIPDSKIMAEIEGLIGNLHLHTICQSAICPNQGDCFSQRTATFLILGDVCTRNCTFCAVKKGVPLPVDENEPDHLTEAVAQMGLRHVVITSVTRDDLLDGGATHYAKVVTRLKKRDRAVTVEVLIPDFQGSPEALKRVVDVHPEVINHNMETISRLYPEVRPLADFQRSLGLFRKIKEFDSSIITKSGFMVGLGETKEELLEGMKELRQAGCDLLTIGQYLQPSSQHHPVVRYIHPEEFEEYARLGSEMGFVAVASAPLVRSSFNASELFDKTRGNPPPGNREGR